MPANSILTTPQSDCHCICHSHRACVNRSAQLHLAAMAPSIPLYCIVSQSQPSFASPLPLASSLYSFPPQQSHRSHLSQHLDVCVSSPHIIFSARAREAKQAQKKKKKKTKVSFVLSATFSFHSIK